MHSEYKRIAQLVGFKPIIPGQRLPVVKVSPEQYSTKQAIRKTLAIYPDIRTLVLCHGRSYSRKSYIKSDVFFLDINPVARPDFLGDIRDMNFMFRFPRGYFNIIHLTYVPPPFPFTHENMPIYLNCHYILERKGQLRSRYIHFMLANKPKYNSKKINVEILKKGPKYYNNIQIIQGKIIMTK